MKAKHILAALGAAATMASYAAPVTPEKALEIVNAPSSQKMLRAQWEVLHRLESPKNGSHRQAMQQRAT